MKIPGVGISVAKTAIKLILDPIQMKKLIEAELSSEKIFKISVESAAGLVEFLKPYLSRDNAEYLAREHYKLRGNLTMNGWVALGKVKEDDNFYLAVGDHPGSLTFWNKNNQRKLTDGDLRRWNQWLNLAGANHRRRVIARVAKAIGTEVSAMEENDNLRLLPDSLIKVERNN